MQLGCRGPRGGRVPIGWLVLVAGCAAQPAEPPPPPIGESQKGLLNPSGPDIGIDEGRLRSSVRVIQGARVSQAEVDEGCAADTDGRTLVRFDVVTPNFGPADLEFGNVSCVSTDPRPACRGVDCARSPECCCDGQSRCTTSAGDFGAAFQFACPHRHIHFTSFAEYRLLTEDGDVVATGHKQSFCLMDIEGARGGSCRAASPFTCGRQGIHAGCADVYSSALPCSFVDATGVPRGDYVLEVTMDPIDAIHESNESNNVARAPVSITVGPIRPPDPTTHLFLVRDGAGTVEEAGAYYASLAPGGFEAGVTTLDDWLADFIGDRPTVSAFYRNVNELGFWREMTCTTTVGRDAGGCWVRNWRESTDPADGAPSLGTVAMRLDAAGRTQFFVFDPGGVLRPTAVLDDEGPKAVPRLCTNCHGGEYGGAGSDPDLGSIFREFEPSQLQPDPAVPEAEAERRWFLLNQAVRSANRAVRSEAEGGPFGVDAARAAMERYVAAMYVTTDPPVSRPVDDPFHVPPSWLAAPTEAERSARSALWRDVVNPYCMTCHRSSVFNYESYPTFATVAAVEDGRPRLRRYIEVDPADPDRERLAFMPQSKLQWQNLSTDAEALLAIERWLGGVTNRPPVAAAGPDVAVDAAATASLSGVMSTDPDGDPLLFEWTQLAGPTVALVPDATSRDVTFVAPDVAMETLLRFRLRARDMRLGESVDEVTVTVRPRTARRFAARDVPLAIPDNNATGVTSSIDVDAAGRIGALRVQVDIAHPWIGDLTVTLRGPGGFSQVLHNRAGRDADDIVRTFLIGPAAGRDARGAWSLEVTDTAAADAGTLRSWSIELELGAAATGRIERPSADTPVAIPDANATGIESVITIPEDREIVTAEVDVDVTHPWKGDLEVRLLGPGGLNVLLHDRAGGSADDIRQTFRVAAAAGRRTAGTWRLRVIDHARADVGRLNRWTLRLDAR